MTSSTDWVGAARDTRHLVAFRARTVRRPAAAVGGALVVVALTVGFAVAPAYFDLDAVRSETVQKAVTALQANLGAAFLGFLALSVSSAMSSGGGRELLSRSEAAIHPISPVTEHLGALLLAPVNLAWLVQMWGLLAVSALVAEPAHLLGAQLVVLAWVLAASTAGQAIGWAVEGVRRTAHGVVVVRVAGGLVVLALAGLHLAGALGPLVRALPTTWLAEAAPTARWPVAVLVLLVVAAAAVVVGARPAAWALGLPPREELRVQSGVHEARHVPEPRKAPLAGNSVGTDKAFLDRDMRELVDHLHYRIIDVSSIKELARRWYPRVYFASPEKHGGHRALADILESIDELRYYRAALMVAQPGPDTAEAKRIAEEILASRGPRA